jgi:hypothetical protein
LQVETAFALAQEILLKMLDLYDLHCEDRREKGNEEGRWEMEERKGIALGSAICNSQFTIRNSQ